MSLYDITIIGSGIVGAATALALARHTSLKILVIEAKSPAGALDPAQYDHRVSAISLASKAIFQNLNCWEAIKAKRISPYTQMQVWDATGEGEIYFNSQTVGEPLLGYIIEDSVVRNSIQEQFSSYQNIEFLYPTQIVTLREKSDCIELTTHTQKTLQTKLLIAADGADSWVRKQAGIEFKNRDYAQTAIVATVTTELSHQATAWQRFSPTGPLAFLPLGYPTHSSIVWSANQDFALHLLSLDDDSFRKTLHAEFGNKLGDITAVTRRYHFPLRRRYVKNYVRSRLVLIGDAAHTIHPLAGQGVNLGLLDAAALAEVVIDAQQKDRDFASLATLRRYERWRKSDTLTMLSLIEGLKYLFGSNTKSLQQIRNMGLTFTNRLAFVKNRLVNYALGKRGDLPRLARLF